MRYFVTGGSGFIGSNYIRHLLASEPAAEVTNYDKLTYAGTTLSLRDLEHEERYRFVRGDICDREAVDAAIAGHDVVVNFAAESHVDRSIQDGSEAVATNTFGVAVMAEAARRAGVGRFVQVGTDEEYGSIREGSFCESAPLAPASPYSAGKAGGSLVALAYARTHGLDVVVTRCTNNYGPWQFPEKVIPLFVTNLLDGAKVPLYGEGGNVRDWLHVDDHCRAIDVVLRSGVSGEVYNVGASNERSNLELTRALLAALGAGEDRIERVRDRLGHDWRYSLDATKLRALGWEPQHPFAEGLAQTVMWYRDNEWWWRPLKQALLEDGTAPQKPVASASSSPVSTRGDEAVGSRTAS